MRQSIQQIGKGKSGAKAVGDRRAWLEDRVGAPLKNISVFSVDPTNIEGSNIENMVGVTQLPLGVAGPLEVHGDYARGSFFLPLSTTEGALVASVSRGCKAIRSAGGCQTRVTVIGATRGPVFKVKNLEEAKKLEVWLGRNKRKLKEAAKKTSRHLKLLDYSCQQLGRNFWVRFTFDTQEAMGMNMVTKATQELVGLIEHQTGVKCVSISGNACVDKKPSLSNMVLGRGKQVWAEVVLPRRVLTQVLKTSAEKIIEVVRRKTWLGSTVHGVMGANGHFANVVAALFVSTGQDLGHIGECSVGFVDAEPEKAGGLYFAIYMPDLMVGTVGGGTRLATQRESLSILNLDKGRRNDSLRFTEIVGAAVLAGELSLTAALASGHLVSAHERLGRSYRKEKTS